MASSSTASRIFASARLELERPGRIRVAELAPDPPLAQAEQELLRGALVDAFRRPRAHRARRRDPPRGSAPPQRARSRSRRCSSESKCSGPSSARIGTSDAMRGDAGERVPLEPLTRVEQPRRHVSGRRRRRRARREAGLRLLREVELVGRVADRVLPLGRVLEARREPRGRGRTPPAGRPRARSRGARDNRDTSRPAPSRCVEAVGKISGIETRRQRDDAHVEALRGGELHAAQRRRLAGRVAVEAEPHACRQPAELLQLPLGECRAHRTRRPARCPPAAARARRCSPRRRPRVPASRSRRAHGRARRAGRLCGTARPPAS